ncbi:MAG: hypothetical protein V4669_15245 [Pseudomonadota bacterium]
MEPTIDSLCTAGRNAIRRANASILERIWTRAALSKQQPLVLTINGRDAHVLDLLKARYLTVRVPAPCRLLSEAQPRTTRKGQEGVDYTFDLYELRTPLSCGGLPVL